MESNIVKDLDLVVFDRIWTKYLKDKAPPLLRLELFREYKRVLMNISIGLMNVEEAKDYLLNLLQSYFGDELTSEDYEAIVNELLRVLKLEEMKTRIYSRFRARTSMF